MSGFEVFSNDLQAASKVFLQVGTEYKGYMPNGGFAPASGGDTEIDKMLGVALQMTGHMHLMIAQAIDQHGRKLGLAYDVYDKAERANAARINKVLQDMVDQHAPYFTSPPRI